MILAFFRSSFLLGIINKLVIMAKDKTTFLIILCVVLAGLIFYFQCMSQKKDAGKSESFVTTGGMQNLGSVEYDLVGDAPQAMDSHDLLGAPDFADLVDSGDHAFQSADLSESHRPLERLQTLADSYIPRVASKALPFAQFAAKPLVHSFSANMPRVNLKGKLYEMNLSEAIRGTVRINVDPNVSVVGKSRYNAEDVYNPGYMTDAYDGMYNKLSGSHRNLPMYTAGAGQASGVGGNGIDLVMDM